MNYGDHSRRLHGGDCPAAKKLVAVMPPSRPHATQPKCAVKITDNVSLRTKVTKRCADFSLKMHAPKSFGGRAGPAGELSSELIAVFKG